MTSHENYTCDEKRTFANAEMKHLLSKICIAALYTKEHFRPEFPNLTEEQIVEQMNTILSMCELLEDVRKGLLS
jgi:hypothetical protein